MFYIGCLKYRKLLLTLKDFNSNLILKTYYETENC